MKLEQLMPTTETEKACIWDIFQAEDRLWDIEAELTEELCFYRNRIQALGEPGTVADAALAKIYKSHIQRINSLLARLPQQRPSTANA